MKTYLVGITIIMLIGVIGAKIYLDNRLVQSNKKNNNIQVTKSVVNNQTKVFVMIAKNWQFDPGEIRVKQGDLVKLTIKSIDVDHGFALPDFNVKVDLKPNQAQTVEFVASKKGEFTFFCNVFCGEGHRDMKGKLIVE